MQTIREVLMTTQTQTHSLVATYDSHPGAEGAIKALQRGGIDMKQLSIIGKDFHTEEHALGYYTSGDRVKFWGGRGALWGSLWGILVGGAFFFIPAVGPLVVMGPLSGWFLGALEGAAIGGAAGALGAALTNMGIPNESVIKYDLDVRAGKFLVIAHGDAELVEKARSILGTTGAAQLTLHGNPWETPGKNGDRQEYVSRANILKLLSDEEVARVSNAEGVPTLDKGDEFLDLQQLGLGVQHMNGSIPDMGHVLPRKSVHHQTWNKILAQLAADHKEMVEARA